MVHWAQCEPKGEKRERKKTSQDTMAEQTLCEGGALDGCNLGRSQTCLGKGGPTVHCQSPI